MPVHSRLAVLGAGTALGTTLVLGGAPSAWACDERPPATATAAPTPAPAQTPASPSPSATGTGSDSDSGTGSATAAPSAARSAPAASLALLPGAERTLVAGGAPVEFTAEIGNTGTAVLDGAAPLPALRNDAARSPQEALRADELLLQVRTAAGWESLPLAVGCDRSLRGGGALPATGLAPGGSARYTFRLSVTDGDAAAQQVDVRLGLRSGSADDFGSAPHTTLRVTRPAAPAAGAPAAAQPSAAESASSAPPPAPRCWASTPRPLPPGAAPPLPRPPTPASGRPLPSRP
ncbi:hypothetical protein OU787_00980 [Kitasatospora sp. YST-16]|uniref:hypothetical protein n=1 Tax=Kitasatospora sp. YST-16 TaxID=2998080 RepID=UPI002283D834|nr:hypothetical protein [Kitasatospora sp. YST-16]WAL70188.1 hypothetical protein OU787_00980 [Kitasatospora sp. YST-16]WNW36229.1 hypothetical protein RKE32_00990 [Streptomyces sp. Li-HN-5-13]